MEFRTDRTTFDGPRKDGRGGLIVNARPTRVGIFVYANPDGSPRRELRPADEVFKADSLSSLAGAPLTILHPDKPVTPDNWNELSHGHVCDGSVQPDGKYVASKLRVASGKAVAGVEKKEYEELSCGYSCDLDVTPGVFEGERYDAVQRNIVYNHLALLPKGCARGGPELKIRLDSMEGVPVEDLQLLEVKSEKPDNLFGMDLAAALEALNKMTAERDALATNVTNLQARLDAAEAACKPERIDALVTSRVQLRDDARKVLGDKLPATDKEIMVAVIQKADSSFRADGRDDTYLRARFDAEVVAHGRLALAGVQTGARTDGAKPTGLAAARAARIEKDQNAWKGGSK